MGINHRLGMETKATPYNVAERQEVGGRGPRNGNKYHELKGWDDAPYVKPRKEDPNPSKYQEINTEW